MTNCKGSWTSIAGRNTKNSPAVLTDWRCECGKTGPVECPIRQEEWRRRDDPSYAANERSKDA